MRRYCTLVLILIGTLLIFTINIKDGYDIPEINEARCGGYDRPKIKERKPYKIVSSFTTSPSRIYKTDKTLYSLTEQTYPLDYMLLNIPEKFARTNEIYTIPDFIKENKQIVINQTDRDYGPATKLVGAILRIPKDEDVWIVVHDDDHLYLQYTINEYTKYIDANKQNKKVCYTASGVVFDENYNVIFEKEHLEKVHLFEGYQSYCVHRSLFEDDFIPYINDALTNEEAFQSDDLILSNYVAKKNASIYIIQNDIMSYDLFMASKCVLEYGLESDALHKMANPDKIDDDPLGGHHQKYIRVFKWLKENNNYYIDR